MAAPQVAAYEEITMAKFFRFPQTPHIAWLGEGAPRDDKVLTPDEVNELLGSEVVVEEKLDGANLGLSLSADGELRAQNRGDYLFAPYSGQFVRLERWLQVHENPLFDAINEHLILFGEWCAARHSLDYACLPDWWLLFDVYDRREQRFWSTQRRNALAQEVGLATVPCLLRKTVTVAQLTDFVTAHRSQYRDGALEGVVVRREDADWLHGRGKLVRAGFTQAIETHWRSRAIEWNRVTLTETGGDPEE